MKGRLLTCYSPVRRSSTPERAFPLDLHVLSTPPAFVLSQDQTLHRKTMKNHTQQKQTPAFARIINKQTQTKNTDQGIQTNSIDYKHTVEFSNIRCTPCVVFRLGSEGVPYVSGLISHDANRGDSRPHPGTAHLVRFSRPASRRALVHPGGVSWRWSPEADCPSLFGSCCPPLPGDSENSRGRRSRVQIGPRVVWLTPASAQVRGLMAGPHRVSRGVGQVSVGAPGPRRSSSCHAAAPATPRR